MTTVFPQITMFGPQRALEPTLDAVRQIKPARWENA